MSRYAAQSLGEQLRRARERAGLGVAEAARLLKVERQTLYNYEKGKSLPKMRALVAAANAWNANFELSGCSVIPRALKGPVLKKPPEVQLELPFTKARLYKTATVRISRRNDELVITAIARIAS